jgi:hypothetical protein
MAGNESLVVCGAASGLLTLPRQRATVTFKQIGNFPICFARRPDIALARPL